MSVDNIKRFIEAMKYFKVIWNIDQTFVKKIPKENRVAARKGGNFVGGKNKAGEKDDFTLMMAFEILSSTLWPPFNVFNGMKIKYATNNNQLLIYNLQ